MSESTQQSTKNKRKRGSSATAGSGSAARHSHADKRRKTYLQREIEQIAQIPRHMRSTVQKRKLKNLHLQQQNKRLHYQRTQLRRLLKKARAFQLRKYIQRLKLLKQQFNGGSSECATEQRQDQPEKKAKKVTHSLTEKQRRQIDRLEGAIRITKVRR
jgi:YesN/AraC family two-component response regulator